MTDELELGLMCSRFEKPKNVDVVLLGMKISFDNQLPTRCGLRTTSRFTFFRRPGDSGQRSRRNSNHYITVVVVILNSITSLLQAFIIEPKQYTALH